MLPLSIQNIHFTGVSGETLNSLKEGFKKKDGWDFSHLGDVCNQLLRKHPSSEIYLFGITESFGPPNATKVAPNVVAVAMPEGNSPSTQVMFTDNQTQEQEIKPIEDLGYDWKSVTPRKDFDYRLYALQCNINRWNTAEDPQFNDNKVHECSSLFIVSPTETKRNKRKRLIIKDVTYSIRGNNYEESTMTYKPSSQSYEDHVKYVLKKFFNNDKSFTKAVKNQLDQAIDAHRKERESHIQKYMEDKTFQEEDLKSISVYKILPLNFPSKTTSKLSNRFYDKFDVQVVSYCCCQMDLTSIQRDSLEYNQNTMRFCIETDEGLRLDGRLDLEWSRLAFTSPHPIQRCLKLNSDNLLLLSG